MSPRLSFRFLSSPKSFLANAEGRVAQMIVAENELVLKPDGSTSARVTDATSTLDVDTVPASPPGLAPVGHGFSPATDSLRAALDGAVLSPAGRVVALDPDGHCLGTASQDDIAVAIRTAAGGTS